MTAQHVARGARRPGRTRWWAIVIGSAALGLAACGGGDGGGNTTGGAARPDRVSALRACLQHEFPEPVGDRQEPAVSDLTSDSLEIWAGNTFLDDRQPPKSQVEGLLTLWMDPTGDNRADVYVFDSAQHAATSEEAAETLAGEESVAEFSERVDRHGDALVVFYGDGDFGTEQVSRAEIDRVTSCVTEQSASAPEAPAGDTARREAADDESAPPGASSRFVSQVNEICSEHRARVAELLSDADDVPAAERALAEMTRLFSEGSDRLYALDVPPDVSQAAWDQFLTAWSMAAMSLAEAEAQFSAGERAEALRSLEAVKAPGGPDEQLETARKELGFDSCGS